MNRVAVTSRSLLAVTFALLIGSQVSAQRARSFLAHEQGRIAVRDVGDYAAAPLPRISTPPTVSTRDGLPEWRLSLDEAIRVALRNAEVVRVLSGVGAGSSGQTIYSPGIANAGIDQARAAFDPNLSVRNNFLRSENPSAQFDPFDPSRAIITGSRSDSYDLTLDLDKRFLSGAEAGLRVGSNRSRFRPGVLPLNPQSTSAVDFSLSQPLLRGRGTDVNAVPIVLAFLDTESSYFRLKNSLQNLVVGVIQGYWDLVQARTERWVIQQNIRQSEEVYEFRRLEQEAQRVDAGDVAQTAASLANFRASLITAEANILDRVASLRAILGIPPGSDFTIVPTTPPVTDRLTFDWEAIVELAERRRPDLIELKIILEADHQRILQARNRARPQLDAVASYRWNGLEGQMPVGSRLESNSGDYTDWSLGVNFSVPLTLRAGRAELRQNELLLANDRANLQQGLLRASHSLAAILRSIDSLYEQREAFQIARRAARVSLEKQILTFGTGQNSFVEVLLAINTWASTVTSEARAITQLNSTLAALEAESGTILETHGIRLYEERYCSLGPLGGFGTGREFPAAIRPTENAQRYIPAAGASEEAFNLEVPVEDSDRQELGPTMQRLPPPESE